MPMSFEEFERTKRAEGFDEVLARNWKPLQIVPEHRHDFVAQAVVTEGEMWLTQAGKTRHLVTGDTFELACNEPHAERYGPVGATYWVARRSEG